MGMGMAPCSRLTFHYTVLALARGIMPQTREHG